MAVTEDASQVQQFLQEIDRLIAEMAFLCSKVAALSSASASETRSVRQAENFGMWVDREDMRGRSSRAWLEDLRSQC